MKAGRKCKWLFIGQIPILLEPHRLAKQLKVELWLNSKPILKTLKLENVKEDREVKSSIGYIA